MAAPIRVMEPGGTGVYPEPVACRIGAGTLDVHEDDGIQLDAGPLRAAPDLPARLSRLLGLARVRPPGRGRAVIRVRNLGAADLRRAELVFQARLDRQGGRPGAYLLDVQPEAAEVHLAASAPEGFSAAFQSLRQLVLRAAAGGPARIRSCLLYDYPLAVLRAVWLRDTGSWGRRDLDRLLDVIAWLKYGAVAVPASEAEGMRALCGEHSLELVTDDTLPASAVRDFDGPTVLDWEHTSRAAGVPGVVVPLAGEPSVPGIARSGSLYNLVYSASALWCRDYDNFAWEKVSALTADLMPEVMRMLGRAETRLPGGPDLDAYPLLLERAGEVLARVDARVDALVFRHALRDSPGSRDARGAGPVGAYAIRYTDGSSEKVVLTENENIGSESAWCGRRYDPAKRCFRLDRRVHSLACFTRPVKKMSGDNRLLLDYELAWSNPHPERSLASVNLEAASERAAGEVRVESIHAVRRLG